MMRGGSVLSLCLLACAKDVSQRVDVGTPHVQAPAVPDATPAALIVDATAPPEVDAGTQPEAAKPGSYGAARRHGLVACTIRKDGFYIVSEDQALSYVDKEDLLALVNRSPMGTLAPNELPTDLVDVRTLEPLSKDACEARQCLRKEAAIALKDLLAEMAQRGFPGSIESPYRSYVNQCLTFRKWAEGGFCSATEQSALPGHSQHQLGTTLDLFTVKWKKDGNGNVFRPGFGCTDAGKYLAEEAYRFGFVLPYPLHPDDMRTDKPCEARFDRPLRFNPLTGYKNEPWHLRYIGKDNAARFHEARQKDNALTLEGWIRQQKGLGDDGDIALPACDGCNCGACASYSEKGPCKSRALHLREDGYPVDVAEVPELKDFTATHTGNMWSVSAVVQVPHGTVTSTPVASGDTPVAHASSSLNAYVLRVASGDDDTQVWNVGLTQEPATRAYAGARVLLPATEGTLRLQFRIESAASVLHASLARRGTSVGPERIAPGSSSAPAPSSAP